MSEVVSAHLLRQDVEMEPQEFILAKDATTGTFSFVSDPA